MLAHVWCTVELAPPGLETLHRGDVFVQDEIELRAGLAATLCIKLESNDYTGVEVLPSARVAWSTLFVPIFAMTSG